MQSQMLTVRGEKRLVSFGEKLSNNEYRARVRNRSNGASIRGVMRKNSVGVWRFYPSNPENLD